MEIPHKTKINKGTHKQQHLMFEREREYIIVNRLSMFNERLTRLVEELAHCLLVLLQINSTHPLHSVELEKMDC
eukprot:m.23258 g.23258  ORF g.23258 m.23258 type:complete len:74 (-) comp5534_c0_seq1:28-249(-)